MAINLGVYWLGLVCLSSTGRPHPCCFYWSGALYSCKIKFISEESKPDLVWLCKSYFCCVERRAKIPLRPGSQMKFLFSPCLLPSPSKFYFYKICRWPHLILDLIFESQHFLETFQWLTSQSSAEHSWAQGWRISFGFCVLGCWSSSPHLGVSEAPFPLTPATSKGLNLFILPFVALIVLYQTKKKRGTNWSCWVSQSAGNSTLKFTKKGFKKYFFPPHIFNLLVCVAAPISACTE